MEGIYDGQACDDCFYCALLYPDTYSDDCPRCGRRMRYQSAVLIDSAQLRRELEKLLRTYVNARELTSRREALERLLIRLHRDLPMASTCLDELAAHGYPALSRLRRDYQHLFATENEPGSINET